MYVDYDPAYEHDCEVIRRENEQAECDCGHIVRAIAVEEIKGGTLCPSCARRYWDPDEMAVRSIFDDWKEIEE
jgi:hypothetical protein